MRVGNMQLRVPRDLVVDSPGLSIDFGGSLIKIVYREEENYRKANENHNESSYATLHLTTFSRESRVEAWEFIKKQAYLLHNNDQPIQIFTTGLGGSQYPEELREALNVKAVNLTEFDCFAKAFNYLVHRVSRDELLKPWLHEETLGPLNDCKAYITTIRALAGMKTSMAKFNTKHLDGVLERIAKAQECCKDGEEKAELPLAEAEDIFPAMLVVCGSAFFWLKLTKDGGFTHPNLFPLGGRGLYGMGSLLTGCKTFEELVQLAEKGNSKNVDTHVRDFGVSSDQENMYNEFTDKIADLVAFPFGKTATRQLGDFKPEDVAQALLKNTVSALANHVHVAALTQGIKRVFLCGGFLVPDYICRLLTAQLTRFRWRISDINSQVTDHVRYDFIRPTQYLGSLGALINSVDKFLDPEAGKEN